MQSCLGEVVHQFKATEGKCLYKMILQMNPSSPTLPAEKIKLVQSFKYREKLYMTSKKIRNLLSGNYLTLSLPRVPYGTLA